MMKRTILLCFAAILAVACSKNNTAVIDAQINGANEKNIFVSQLAVNQLKFIDTVKTDSKGGAKYEVTITDEAPNFYYLSYNGKKLASLILKPGDKVKVTVDTLGAGLKIEGSEESLLAQKYDADLAKIIADFGALSAEVVKAADGKDEKKVKELNTQMGKAFVQYKQSTLKSIMQNPYSFANVQALYQSITPTLPVFGDANDYMIFQRVHDSLVTLYPNSVYVKSLQEELKAFKDSRELAARLTNAIESSFPNISLPDINAKNVELKSLEGKPFILMFWTTTDANQKMYNNDLKDLYKKYSPAGLEIYQVCVDIDKTAWATAVKEQELPWISVCDGYGVASPAVSTYNVANVPTLFIFNRQGDIVAKNVFTKAKLEAEIKKAIR